jgi:hypothetical protein
VKNAVAELLTQIGSDDRVGLFSLSNRLTTLQKFTTDRNAVLSTLLNVRPSGQTALYDSMAQLARDRFRDGGKKVILMFTDGLDNASVLTIESAVTNVRRIGVPIYAVAQGEILQNREVLKRLKEISESTNGVAFEAKKPDDLREIFSTIGRDLQHLYLLGYYSSSPDTREEWRKINVKPIRQGTSRFGQRKATGSNSSIVYRSEFRRYHGTPEAAPQFVVEITLRANLDEVSPPIQSIVRGLDDTWTFQPAPEREGRPEPFLRGYSPAKRTRATQTSRVFWGMIWTSPSELSKST